MVNVNRKAQEGVEGFVLAWVREHGSIPKVSDVAEALELPQQTARRYRDKALRKHDLEVTSFRLALTLEQREGIVADARAGLTVDAIAARAGVAEGTVWRVCSEAEVSITPRTPKRSTEMLQRVLNSVVTLTATRGLPPTTQAIADDLGLTTQTVTYHVGHLAERGLVLAPGGRSGVSLRGARFHADCRTLAQAATTPGSGVPESARRAVLALVGPVMRKPPSLVKPAESSQTLVGEAVPHLLARYGRPVVASDLRDALGNASPPLNVLRAALRTAESAGVLVSAQPRAQGYLPTAGDPLVAPALLAQKLDSRGWNEGLYRCLQRALKVVLLEV